MENNNEKINCRACGSSNLIFWTEKNSCKLYKCGECQAISAGKAPDFSKIYSRDYFFGAKDGFGYANYNEDKLPMAETFIKFLDIIERFTNKKNLLDVGAASGFFMEIAHKKGWSVYGVEISDFAAAQARNEGLQVVTGTLEDLQNKNKHFDVITMWDVIEHMPNPVKVLSIVNELLEDGGIVAINTPDSGSLVARILGKNWHLLIPPEHLIIFNQQNLSELLKKQGFEVLLTAKMGKKFTIKYIFRILANWRRHSDFFRKLSNFLANNFLGRLSLPVNLRDNFFIIAKKI